MVVVLALLGMLLLVGFMFYTLSNQEQANAEYFMRAAKESVSGTSGSGGGGGSGFGAEFEIALRQLIVGPETNETNSALWGGRKSLLATMFGRDIHPFTGRGVDVIAVYDNFGNLQGYAVDQNGDGIPDDGANGPPDNRNLLEVNDSPAAWGNAWAAQVLPLFSDYPSPDVDYTYPDHNNLFLAYHGFGLSTHGAPIRVVIPSFHRPAVLRAQDVDGHVRTAPQFVDVNGNRQFDSGEDQPGLNGRALGWWSSFPQRILRAHPEHADVDPNALNPAVRGRRYILTQAEADALGATGPFPFAPDYPNERLPNGALAEQGIWSLSSWRADTWYNEGQWAIPSDAFSSSLPQASGLFYRCMRSGRAGAANQEPAWPQTANQTVTETGGSGIEWRAFSMMTTNYEYDADPDGDGIREAVWLDLDAPVVDLPGGRKGIRLYAITAYDADGLLNLNAHGNIEGRVNLAETRANVNAFGFDYGADGIPGGGDDVIEFLSRSSPGLSPSEVNPQYGLNAGRGANGDLAPADSGNDVFEQLRLYFGHDPVDATELSNMEWWLLNVGRLHFQGSVNPANMTNFAAGRYGEMDAFVQNFFRAGMLSNSRYDYPGAGTTGQDDAVPGRDPANPSSYNRTYSTGLTTDNGQPQFGHPMDFRGLGQRTRSSANAFERGRLARLFDTWARDFNPTSWPQYMNYSYPAHPALSTFQWPQPPMPVGALPPVWSLLLANPPGNLGPLGEVSSTADGELLRRIVDPLVDEAYELDLESALPQGSDARFSLSDSAALQMSGADIDNLSLSSRLFTLAEYNLRRNARSNDLRRRFTTISRDMKTFGTAYDLNFPAPRQETEWGPDPLNAGRPTFPWPWVGAPQQDRMRQELRRLLRVVADDVDNPDPTGTTGLRVQQQRKLSVNHVLEEVGALLRSRALTPHHPDPGTNPLPPWTGNPPVGVPPYPANGQFANAQDQEIWARLDRQRLARDIYTLLYLFCGGDDSVNYSTTRNTARGPDTMRDPNGRLGLQLRDVYDDWQLIEMAQFAVNVVDNLDRDSVMTAFEFDLDLFDGWDPDDNPYPPPGPPMGRPDLDPAKLRGQHGLVYGVEAQRLTVSEAIAVKALRFEENGQPRDIDVTMHQDTEDRIFCAIELRNAYPSTVNVNRGQWQIEAEIDPDGNGPLPPRRRQLTLHHVGMGASVVPEVPGGGLMAILSMSDRENYDETNPSAIQPNSRFTIDFEYPDEQPRSYAGDAIIPKSSSVPTLDLIEHSNATGNSNHFALKDPDNAGRQFDGLLDSFNVGSGALPPEVRLVLKRRVHLDRTVPTPTNVTAAYDADNPWVVVDEMRISSGNGSFKLFDMNGQQDTGTAARRELVESELLSRERGVPLNRNGNAGQNGEQPYAEVQGNPPNFSERQRITTADPLITQAMLSPAEKDRFKWNSIGLANGRSLLLNRASELWQAHLDRDFANVGELFAIPLYGPEDVTQDLAPTGRPVGWNTAGARKFLRPHELGFGLDGAPGNQGFDDDRDGEIDELDEAFPVDQNGVPQSDDVAKLSNRWHRLFEFVEVPTPANSASLPSLSGRMNWNTIRYPSGLAGLVDDRSAFGTFSDWIPGSRPDFAMGERYMGDASGETDRDWWVELVRSRDHWDRVTGTILPGNPEARPFRGLNYAGNTVASINQTYLRSLPKDVDEIPALPEWHHRRLFELSTPGQRDAFLDPTSGSAADSWLKHGVLSKMLNNSTTRSNVFFVFIEVGLFEVVEDGNAERIGAKISGAEQPRGLFIIDRTRAYEQIDRQHFVTAVDPNDPAVFRFVGFPWESLVVHSQRIE